MKKSYLLLIVVAALVVLNIKVSHNNNNTDTNLSLVAMNANADGTEGCINKPGQNNGHCVGDGIGNYFCGETSWYLSNDCVKGM